MCPRYEKKQARTKDTILIPPQLQCEQNFRPHQRSLVCFSGVLGRGRPVLVVPHEELRRHVELRGEPHPERHGEPVPRHGRHHRRRARRRRQQTGAAAAARREKC